MMNDAIKDIERAVRLAKQVMSETPLEILSLLNMNVMFLTEMSKWPEAVAVMEDIIEIYVPES